MTEQIKESSIEEYVNAFMNLKHETLSNATAAIVKKTQELLAAGEIDPIDSDVSKNPVEKNIPLCSYFTRSVPAYSPLLNCDGSGEIILKDTRPICPDCKTIMVKTHIELSDGSGWFTGWACDCKYEECL